MCLNKQKVWNTQNKQKQIKQWQKSVTKQQTNINALYHWMNIKLNLWKRYPLKAIIEVWVGVNLVRKKDTDWGKG